MTDNDTVYVVDDDVAARDSLAVLLQTAGYQVECHESGRGFLDGVATEGHGCIILDLRMPDLDGLEVQRRLNERKITLPVIIVTGHGDVPLAVLAMKAGAWDFVEKPYSDDTLLGSVAEAIKADRAHRQATADSQAFSQNVELLTVRERDVLDCLVVGQSNKEIALTLGISPRTVEIHRSRVIEKLQVRNYAELIRYALQSGLIPPTDPAARRRDPRV